MAIWRSRVNQSSKKTKFWLFTGNRAVIYDIHFFCIFYNMTAGSSDHRVFSNQT